MKRLLSYLKKRKKASEPIDEPKPRRYTINNSTIVDTYPNVNNYDIVRGSPVIAILEEAIVKNTFQSVYLDIPLDCNHIGEHSLVERVLSLLFGKLIINSIDYFLWVARTYKHEYVVCATTLAHPDTVVKAAHLHPVKDEDPLSSEHKFSISQSYISELDHIYTEALRQIRLMDINDSRSSSEL